MPFRAGTVVAARGAVTNVGDSARVLLALSLLIGCGSSGDPLGPRCTHPDRATYSTAPQAAGTPGCSGTPHAFAAPAVPDPSATFSAGTTITLPICHPYYPTFAATCSCTSVTSDGGPGFEWVCPL